MEDFEIESILVNEALSLTDRVPTCKRIRTIFCSWNTESRGKFLLVKSKKKLRKFRNLLKVKSRIHVLLKRTGIRNPRRVKKKYLESKTVLDSITWGEIEALVSRTVVQFLVEQSRFSTRLIYADHRQLVSRTWITNGKMVLRLLWPRVRVTKALPYETSIIWNDLVDAAKGNARNCNKVF